jgi:hypothetical protein
MRRWYRLAVLPVLLALAGCAPLGSQDAATSAGKDYAGKAADAAGAAGQKAQDVAVHDPHLVAAALVAVAGALVLKFLLKSVQVRYLLVAAVVAWIAYAAGQTAR